MSISHKKINSMIQEAVYGSSKFPENQKDFIELCQRIYLIESASSTASASRQVISDVKEEIERRSQVFNKGD